MSDKTLADRLTTERGAASLAGYFDNSGGTGKRYEKAKKRTDKAAAALVAEVERLRALNLDVLLRAADAMDADPEFRDPLRLKSGWLREYAERESSGAEAVEPK